MAREDRIWQEIAVSKMFLEGQRGAIPLAHEQIDVMLRLIRAARGDEVTRFLDLGCGDGILSRALLNLYPDAFAVMLDFSAPMLDVAREKMGTKNPRFSFLQVDYADSDWVNAVTDHGPFDVIVSGFSIHHQPDERKKEVYQELYDVLVPGGVFLNLEHVSSPTSWVESVYNTLMIDARYAYQRQEGKTPTYDDVAEEYHTRLDKDANLLAPLDLQLGWLREIGFEHVDCYFKIFELALFGALKPA